MNTCTFFKGSIELSMNDDVTHDSTVKARSVRALSVMRGLGRMSMEYSQGHVVLAAM